MSDVGDEIDFEMTGNPPNPVTNIYSKVLGKSSQEQEHFQHYTTITSVGLATSHVYTIDWKHDSVEWLIDGVSVRFLRRGDSKSALYPNQEWFPNTPSLFQVYYIILIFILVWCLGCFFCE